MRWQKWKLALPGRTQRYGYAKDPPVADPILLDLQEDIGETKNVAAEHPEVVERLLAMAKTAPTRIKPQGRGKK